MPEASYSYTRNFDAFPMVDEVLNRLLDRTEKAWGYFQIKKREIQAKQKERICYVMHLAGSHEDLVTVYNDSNNSYELYWYTNSRPSVFVEVKTNKVHVLKETKTNREQKDIKQRNYKVCYENNPNPLVSSINRRFAELIKERIVESASELNPEEEKQPLVTLVQL